MIKNTEWGAVAYLSHSIYGIGTEININNDGSCLTGKSALPNLDQHTSPGIYGTGDSYNESYNTKVGFLASTTGNITGVYDMSGGVYEHMAAYIKDNYGSSLFTESTISNYNAKYFDIYNKQSNATSYSYRIIGDATGELSPIYNYVDGDGTRNHNWYGDISNFVSEGYPWFSRGGFYGHGLVAGQFAFPSNNGGAYGYISYRVVLSP